MDLARRISVARGEQPADLAIRGGRLVNVLSGETYQTDIAIADGRIAGLGRYDGKETFDASGCFAAPGFIDAHLHIESSCLTVPEFARSVVPMGTTTVVTDPHEMANVLGLDGIRFMLESSHGLSLNVLFMLPSCVPSTELETSGARLDAADLAPLLTHPSVLGLAEVMNYPGVLAKNPQVLAKISMASDRIVDGHAPGLSGRDLCAYIGAGIRSDHECTTLDEAREKLRLGMHVLIREGSVAKNMAALLPLVTPAIAHRFGLVSDDRLPVDLLAEGHLNGLLRKAVSLGLPPVTAIQMVTINPATFFALKDLGAVAPGYRADIVLLDDLQEFRVRAVFKDGRLVARDGSLLADLPRPPQAPRSSIRIGWDHIKSFEVPAPRSGSSLGRVIEVMANQLVTKEIRLSLPIRDGMVAADPERDVAKLAVVERHHGTGNVGVGFARGLGVRQGAIASSVAHDSHNIVVAGANDRDMLAAVKTVERLEGGLVAVNDGRVLAAMPLPIAGLLSGLSLDSAAKQMADVMVAARTLGCLLPRPFMALSFLALPVIPELKLTDRGLVDVARSALVPLFVEA
jgi:adenine deaminase